jgi:hypothetical protein
MNWCWSSLNWYGIPERMRGGIERWIEHGIPPGDFLTAVLKNDLMEACGRADDENRHLLFNYMQFFYNEAPPNCWGSPENYEHWSKLHAARRLAKAEKP